jgi:hypothetical protein
VKLVWPILSGLLAVMVLLGLAIAWREGWHPMSRTLAIVIGATGILLTGLVAAIAVRALERATKS